MIEVVDRSSDRLNVLGELHMYILLDNRDGGILGGGGGLYLELSYFGF